MEYSKTMLESGISLPSGLSKPAQRALAGAGIADLAQLSQFSETQIRELHGIGPNALGKLQQALKQAGLGFAEHK